MMKIHVRKGELSGFATEAAVAAHFEGETALGGAAEKLNRQGKGILAELIAAGDFTGRWKETAVLYPKGGMLARRIIAVGLGKRDAFTADRLRCAFAAAAQKVRSLNLRSFATAADFADSRLPADRAAEAVVEGAILGLYRFCRYKTRDLEAHQEVGACSLLHSDGSSYAAVKRASRAAAVIAEAACFARDIVSTPGNEMTPARLAAQARESAVLGSVACRVIGPPQMKRMGMNALLAVGSGSCHPPQLILLTYQGGKKAEPPLALVGKGLTFDSGGISLKPADKMEQMKSDMAGGAVVIAAIRAAALLKLPVNILGVVPAAENLPGGNAYRPGDIIKSFSGQTIEIISTDAEGRLILADALTYAARRRPAAIIDLATLTGACVVALGEEMIGMMGKDAALKEKVASAAGRTAEMVWELPLGEAYDELIKGEAADYKNTGGRWGGASTAAAFLEKFTDGLPWVHLDIAGPAWRSSDRPYIPKGASGVGVRLLVDLLRAWSDQTDS